MTGLLARSPSRFYICVVNEESIGTLAPPPAGSAPALERAACSEWRNRSLRDMITRLEHEHHQILRSIIFHSAMLLHDAAAIDPGGATESMRSAFREFSDELIMHIEKEEHLLFPALLALEAASQRGGSSLLEPGEIHRNIDSYALQHAMIGRRLTELREESAGLERTKGEIALRLLDNLDALESHVHACLNLENDVLFPRAIALEDGLKRTPPTLSAERK